MNIPIPFTYTAETETFIESMGKRSWRWTVELERWHIAIAEQFRHASNGNKWGHGSRYFMACLSEHSHWGRKHGYYDGPHCGFSLGHLQFSWSYWDCKICCAGL